jgi:hypothetical protein
MRSDFPLTPTRTNVRFAPTIGIGGSLAAPPTGSREAVARLPFPQIPTFFILNAEASALGGDHVFRAADAA